MKCITDNAHSHKPWEGPYELVQTNGITAGNDFGYGYSTVRIANNFIINVDKCDISEGLKERMKQKPFLPCLAVFTTDYEVWQGLSFY